MSDILRSGNKPLLKMLWHYTKNGVVCMANEEKPVNRVKVNINGEDYYIKGTASEDYIKRVAKYVDKKMYELEQKYTNLSRTKLAVLAAINIADELFRLKQEYEEFLTTFDASAKE